MRLNLGRTMSAGDWQELGFKDGSKGANIDRVHKYTNVCAEHGVSVQSSLYSKGYEQGLPHSRI